MYKFGNQCDFRYEQCCCVLRYSNYYDYIQMMPEIPFQWASQTVIRMLENVCVVCVGQRVRDTRGLVDIYIGRSDGKKVKLKFYLRARVTT